MLEWAAGLPPGCTILDVGCGHGQPIAQALIGAGFRIAGVDASPTLLAEFRKRFPESEAQCAPAEESDFFGRKFDAAIAWGLLFVMPEDRQRLALPRIAAALNPGGRLLFTAPKEVASWRDSLTERESFGLGEEVYLGMLSDAGLVVEGHASDEGENYYYLARRPPQK